MAMGADPVVLAAKNVSKAFFGNPVLRNVSIELISGRIHALLGENGAGKSTLINILSGALDPDSGSLATRDGEVSSLSPAAAQRLGIAVVQQELSLAPHLSIAENIGLGALPQRVGIIKYRDLGNSVAEVCAEVGLGEPPDLPVGRLTLGRRQVVEIAKALYRNPRVLILDEPTSSLSAHEVANLVRLVRRLSSQGVAILYISHRLNEILSLCSYVTVLKDGAVTADRPLAGLKPTGLVRLMVGRDPKDLFPPYMCVATDDAVLETRGFRAGMATGVDLSLRRGEILGIGGLVGHGQEDLLLGMFGFVPSSADSFAVAGRPPGVNDLPFASVVEARQAGVVYVPADRKKEGLLLPHSIDFNLLLPMFARHGARRRDRKKEFTITQSLAKRFGIRGNRRRPVQALSGGNQQKVALAKWLPLTPSILLLNDPTRGVDVETKREIYLLLRAMLAEGKSVVLLSTDTPELVHLCDRVMVILKGRVETVLHHEEATEEAIVSAALGVGEAARAKEVEA
jgi:ribose transport system ATP-binding protein